MVQKSSFALVKSSLDKMVAKSSFNSSNFLDNTVSGIIFLSFLEENWTVMNFENFSSMCWRKTLMEIYSQVAKISLFMYYINFFQYTIGINIYHYSSTQNSVLAKCAPFLNLCQKRFSERNKRTNKNYNVLHWSWITH